MGFHHQDPLMALMVRWLDRRDDYERLDAQLGRVADLFIEELVESLKELADTPVDYDEVKRLTGIPLKTLQNRQLPNIGSAQRGQFRLGDLPFRAGAASPSRLVAALDQLVVARAAEREVARKDREARRARVDGTVRQYQARSANNRRSRSATQRRS
jgi:hypothetical protein